MLAHIDRIKQYPGPEQVRLRVEVNIPGSWFGGELTAAERREYYSATAVDYAEVHQFGVGRGCTKEKAIRFLCIQSGTVAVSILRFCARTRGSRRGLVHECMHLHFKCWVYVRALMPSACQVSAQCRSSAQIFKCTQC